MSGEGGGGGLWSKIINSAKSFLGISSNEKPAASPIGFKGIFLKISYQMTGKISRKDLDLTILKTIRKIWLEEPELSGF